MSSRRIIAAFALTLLFCGSASWAQDQQPGQVQGQQQPNQPQPNQPQDNLPQAPIQPVDPNDAGGAGNHQAPAPAARALFGGANDGQVDTAVPTDDTHPLNGAEAFALGSPITAHNVFDLALHVNFGADTGVVPGETNELLSAGGLFSLNHSWSRYTLTAQYSGAENLYHPASYNDSAFQNFTVIQTIQFRRFTLRLRDDFGQSNGAAFGGFYSGGAFFTSPEGLVTAVAPVFMPNQTILTGDVERLSNLSLAEVDYSLSRRADLTFAASYGFLHFLNPGEIDSQNEDGRVGYGYQLDRKNTLGVVYDYSGISFSGGNGRITTNTGQAAFGRKLTGRTAFQFSAGPQFVTESLAASNLNQVSWSLYSVIKRQVKRDEFWASYNHGVSNGSGVLQGAHTDTVTGFAEVVLPGNWLGSLTAGYAMNSSLLPVATGTGTMTSDFDDWFAGLNVSHLWDRMIRTNFNYGLQRQITKIATCPVQNCGATQLRQVVSLTVDFHLRPIGFE